ncbi:Nucleotide-binding universal stress protein, UspA family [Daejeonella rubra]|uniref:Nucleotide-binding universal stress protein, UspA family n=1 Tax=Daejeonella rubra TaxID=990371 RepID=A0A1G9LRT5_9SPHI|nr:universal stress protein [Daejeonella rubra]SDL64679.1 Nucleotide-binding universal stress protein, UspA family [Daejeonella rubra]
MTKILVTTDFSANSKAGIRFAIQLSLQRPCELTFFHSYHVVKPSNMNETKFTSFQNTEAVSLKKKLEAFVNAIYKQLDIDPANVHYVVSSSFITDSNIMKYATDHNFEFICISRRGSGKVNKIFGTNTSNLILHSKVPVIAVPNTYRISKIKSVLYASDLANLENEIGIVVDFAKPLNAEIELLHLNYPSDVSNNVKVVEEAILKFPKADIKYHLENINLIYNLVTNIQTVIKKAKPSVLVMFTDQDLNFFEKLFLSSSTAEYSLNASVPLLVFKKN